MLYEQIALIENATQFKENKSRPDHPMNFFTKEGNFNKTLFLRFFKNNKFRRPKVLGIFETNTGRKDLFFCVNSKDERRFLTWKYAFGIKYWEEVPKDIYGQDLKDKLGDKYDNG